MKLIIQKRITMTTIYFNQLTNETQSVSVKLLTKEVDWARYEVEFTYANDVALTFNAEMQFYNEQWEIQCASFSNVKIHEAELVLTNEEIQDINYESYSLYDHFRKLITRLEIEWKPAVREANQKLFKSKKHKKSK